LFAIEQVPLPNGIERIEERVIGNGGYALPGRVNPVIGRVEGFHRVAVEQPRWQCERQLGAAPKVEFLTMIGGVVAAKKNATRVLSGKTVEPGHRVFEAVVAFTAQVEKSLQGLKGDRLGVDPGTSNRFELNVGPGDYAGQPETADGGVQHVGILFGVADYQTVVRAMQGDLEDVSSKGSSAVMILAVDVIGDGSADRHNAGAGSDGKKPSFRKEYIEEVGEADAGFTAEQAS